LQQSPGFRYDTISRNSLNLIGLPLQKVIPKLQSKVINNQNGLITLDKGTNDEIMVGNIFSSADKKIRFSISRVYPDSAIGKVAPTFQIKKNDLFIMSDRYRVSSPIIKIHIPASSLTSAEYMEMFNKQILPLTKSKTYNDYFNFSYNENAPTFLFTNQKNSGQEISKIANNREFYVLMAIPSDIANSIKAMLQKEQSIQLVNSPSQANFVLYLNYAVVSEDNKSPRFVFSFREPLPNDIKTTKTSKVIFWESNADISTLLLSRPELTTLNKRIRQITYNAIRSTGTRWINTYPRR